MENLSDYTKLVDKMGRAIEVKNRQIIDNQIRTKLKKYFRAETPGTGKKKPITPNERMMLEAVARGYDSYAKTADTSMLKTTLDTLDMVEKLGKGKLKNIKIVSQREIDREVAKVKDEGISSVYKESSDKLNSVTKLAKGFHYLFIDIYRIANQALDGALEGTMAKRITDLVESRNNVDEIKADFANYVSGKLKGTEWQGMKQMERLGEYMTMKQEDFGKYILNED